MARTKYVPRKRKQADSESDGEESESERKPKRANTRLELTVKGDVDEQKVLATKRTSIKRVKKELGQMLDMAEDEFSLWREGVKLDGASTISQCNIDLPGTIVLRVEPKGAVRWLFEEKGRYENMSPETSAAIESAFAKGCSEVKYTSGKQTYTTLLPPLGSDTAKQTNDSSGTVRELRRMLIEDPVQIPKTWPAWMTKLPEAVAKWRATEVPFLWEIDQTLSQPLWDEVVGPGSFNLGTVQRVFAVINPALADGFALKKAEMQRRAARNKTRLQERTLFHGTVEKHTKSICENGFDPRLAKEDSQLGRGAYFASSASYSLRFAHPNKRNRRFMFLAKVLVGSTCKGRPGITVGDPIDSSVPGDRADTAVNDVGNPTLFCVFDKQQALPEFLIEF